MARSHRTCLSLLSHDSTQETESYSCNWLDASPRKTKRKPTSSSKPHKKTASFASTLEARLSWRYFTQQRTLFPFGGLIQFGARREDEVRRGQAQQNEIQRVVSLASPRIQHVLVHGKDPCYNKVCSDSSPSAGIMEVSPPTCTRIWRTHSVVGDDIRCVEAECLKRGN